MVLTRSDICSGGFARNVVAPSNEFTLLHCEHTLIEGIFRDRRLPLEAGGTTPMDVYIPREEGDFLFSLVRHYCPKLTVEIGMANGLSSLFLALAHSDNGPDGRHIAIDPYQQSEWGGVGMGLIRQAGLAARVRLVEQVSHQGLPMLEREGLRAGLIFIDGAHLFDYALTDFLVSDRILDIGGLIAFDDSDWPAVQGVIRYALTNRHYEVAHPEIVIEPPPGRPKLAVRASRFVARSLPPLATRLKSDFLVPSENLGIIGRCVVLRKTAEDDRDSQSPDSHRPF
jgi:predicted O-methyltransferase YrrM